MCVIWLMQMCMHDDCCGCLRSYGRCYVCCSVLQWVVMSCSVAQWVAVSCSKLPCVAGVAVCCRACWSLLCVPWLIHVCAMTHSCVCHDSFACVTWFIHVKWFTHMCLSNHFIYGVATIRRLHKITGLFCKRAPEKRRIFCKRDLYFWRAY